MWCFLIQVLILLDPCVVYRGILGIVGRKEGVSLEFKELVSLREQRGLSKFRLPHGLSERNGARPVFSPSHLRAIEEVLTPVTNISRSVYK
jgi:hypothetical protein